MTHGHWPTRALGAALTVLVTSAAFAAGDPDGTRGPTDAQKPSGGKPPAQKKQRKSESELRDGYLNARAMIMAGRHAEGIAALRALEADDHPEVANYIGYAMRKLGAYDDARRWYERALAADPTHVRTWQYYGMWHLEQGNRLKAQDHLETIRLICGTKCQEYQDLKGGIEGIVAY